MTTNPPKPEPISTDELIDDYRHNEILQPNEHGNEVTNWCLDHFDYIVDHLTSQQRKVDKASKYIKAIVTGKLDKGSCITMAVEALAEIEALNDH